MRRATFAVGLLLEGGCVLITGGTDGYSLRDSGSDAPNGCSSAASCSDGGVCCLGASSLTTLAGTCLPSCAVALPQLCTTNEECGDAGPCSMVVCTPDGGAGISFSLHACGHVQGCSP